MAYCSPAAASQRTILCPQVPAGQTQTNCHRQVRHFHWGRRSSLLSHATCAVPATNLPSRRGRALARVVCSASSFGSADAAEKALKTTVELDKFIDKLRSSDANELPKLVAENIFSFDQNFWLRLATRAESCTSELERESFTGLSSLIMKIVETVVRKTQDEINSSTDVVSSLLQPLLEAEGEIVWPPRDPSTLEKLKETIAVEDAKGTLDERFIASITALLRQTTERADRPGLVAMLQKVLQIFAAMRLTARSYAVRDSGDVDVAEQLLETILSADEDQWSGLVQSGLSTGGGAVEASDLTAAIERRMERMLMRTEGGSYEQRVLGEYLKEVESRVSAAMEAFNTPGK